MLTILKLIRSFVKIITSQSATWQVFLGTWIGLMLGLMTWWVDSTLNPLAVLLLLVAVFINVHLGSVLMFAGIGALLSLLLDGLILTIGHDMLGGVAISMAEIPIAYSCNLSSTRGLGQMAFGLVLGPILGIAMAWFSALFERHVRAKIEERKRLKAAGKMVGNSLIFKFLCWFLGLS